MKKHFFLFVVLVLLAIALIVGYLKWLSFSQTPYEWTREGDVYTNAHYGLQITKKDGWLRSVEGPSLESRFFLSRLFDNPSPLLFSKRNLMEFHEIGGSQRPDAVIVMGPVDDLKGKYYGRSPRDYARATLGSMAATKMRLNKAEFSMTDINGTPCAMVRSAIEIRELGEIENEYYFLISGVKGFNIVYSAVPSKFGQHLDEAREIVRSIHFLRKQ